jgi:putative DNA primase/helicase
MSENTMHAAAQRYAALGYAVFPCGESKAPLTVRGFHDASTDPAKIADWWKRWPDAAIGIAAAGLLVVDIDGDGNAWPEDAGHRGGLEAVPTSMTPSGGRHHVFRRPDGVRWACSTSKLAHKVDTRTDGGYIIAPPSRIKTGGYQWASGGGLEVPRDELPTPPEWLHDALDRIASPAEPAVVVDDDDQGGELPTGSGSSDPDLIERASRYLDKMPEAVSGQGGHSRLYAAAVALVHGFGLDGATALGMLRTQYNPRCRPRWTERELRHKVREAAEKPHDKPYGHLRDAAPPAILTPPPAPGPASLAGEDAAADLSRPSTLTDVGLARRLARMMRGKLLYVRERHMFAAWDGRRWLVPADHVAQQTAKKMHDGLWRELRTLDIQKKAHRRRAFAFVDGSGTRTKIAAAISLAQTEPGISASISEFDAHPMLLNCRNGILDLTNGDLLPHDPDRRLTQLANVDYVPGARSELWERFIREVTCDREDLAEFLQQAFGLALTGDVSDEVLICHNGGGCNGKSTALEAVGKMLGDYAAVAPPGMFAARKFDAHPTEIAGLRGKRFVTATEQEGNKSLRESLVKQMTGGDTIRTRGMREDFWEMAPTWHIHIAYNTAPRLTGTDDGIRRRLRVAKWDASFKDAPDPTIKERLTGEAERSGILAWCLDGLRKRLAAGRLVSPLCVLIATDDYIDDEDMIGRFIADRTEPDASHVVELRDVLRAFRAWLQADGAPRYVIDGYTATTIGRELARRGFRKTRPESGVHRKQTVIYGLRLADTDADQPDYGQTSDWGGFQR